jgi:ankyrin repeat protein
MASAAFQAVSQNDLAELERLLAADPGLAGARNEQGVSLLITAAYQQRQPIVERLLAAGAPVDAFAAAALGREADLAAWIDREPGLVDAFSPDGFTLLHLAAFFGHTPIVERLLARGASPAVVARNPMRVQPLHSAAALRQLGAARALVAAGADVNARQAGGWTPLHAAAQAGDLELIRLLLDRGADPRLANDEGIDAIGLARSKGQADAFALLAAALET